MVQHAFAVLFRQRERVTTDNDGLFRYLSTVSRHRALDRIKAARRGYEHASQVRLRRADRASTWGAPETPQELPAEELPADEREKIWQVLCALDDFDRLLLWSHVVEGKSIRAIARDLDLNWHRVAGVIERSLRRVRVELLS